jgi:hypothetical protein
VCKKRCENSGKYGTISQGALRELYLRGGGLLCVQDMVHTQGTPECTQKQFADSKEGHFKRSTDGYIKMSPQLTYTGIYLYIYKYIYRSICRGRQRYFKM